MPDILEILDINLFNIITTSFKEKLGDDYEVKLDIKSSTYKYSIKKGTKTGILNVYVKVGGKVSYNIQGSQIMHNDCEICRNILIKETKIEPPRSTKTFTIRNISTSEFELLIDFIKEKTKYIIASKAAKNDTIKYFYKISSEHKEQITVTYYNNGTFLTQGTPTALMINFISYITELITDENIAEEQKKYFEIKDEDTKIIDPCLKNHIVNNYDKIDGKISVIFENSLILLNSQITLTDYSPYSFPCLRALEGILKKKIQIKNDKDFIGNYFTESSTGIFKLKDRSKFSSSDLSLSIENAYNHYHKYRHVTFHFDTTVETTRTLNFAESKEIIENTIEIVKKICQHW